MMVISSNGPNYPLDSYPIDHLPADFVQFRAGLRS
jgi:hypothetical protein